MNTLHPHQVKIYPTFSYDFSLQHRDTDRRSRRVVQYRHPDDMWDYIGGGKRLPGGAELMRRRVSYEISTHYSSMVLMANAYTTIPAYI
jgi:hypothetical protein